MRPVLAKLRYHAVRYTFTYQNVSKGVGDDESGRLFLSPVSSVGQDAGHHDDLLDATRLLGGIDQLDGPDVVLRYIASRLYNQ